VIGLLWTEIKENIDSLSQCLKSPYIFSSRWYFSEIEKE